MALTALTNALDVELFFISSMEYVSTFTSFTDTQFRLQRVEGSQGVADFVCLRRLVDEETCKKRFQETLAGFEEVLNSPWTYSASENEAKIVADIAKTLKPMCREILVEKKEALREQGLKTASLGLGTRDTWHGSPDLRLRPAMGVTEPELNVVVNEEEEEEEEDEEQHAEEEVTTATLNTSDVSKGDGVNFEAKCNINYTVPRVVSKVVATTVVAAFTNHKRHPDLIPITTVVLICKRRVRLCFYDCQHDILLLSDPIPLLNNGSMCKDGLAAIWIALHYKEVCCIPDYYNCSTEELKSTIKKKLAEMNKLKNFQELTKNNVSWPSQPRKRLFEVETQAKAELPLPSCKRSRTQ